LAAHPPAVTPKGDGAFTFEPGTGCVQLGCLGEHFAAVLVATPAALDEAMRDIGGRDVALDGEFDHVWDERRNRQANRVALLTLLPLGGSTAYALHFPALFGRPRADGGYAPRADLPGLAGLLAFLQAPATRKLTWDGLRADAPALRYALPGLFIDAGGWEDSQAAIARDIRTGAMPADTPLSLAKLVVAVFGVAMDKSFQQINWTRPPAPGAVAYAASDVILLDRIAAAHASGVLPGYCAAAAAAAAAAADALKADEVLSGRLSRGATTAATIAADQRAAASRVNCKHALQVHTQRSAGGVLPEYTSVRTGLDHAPTFVAEVALPGAVNVGPRRGRCVPPAQSEVSCAPLRFRGEAASTKRGAEQHAAHAALSALGLPFGIDESCAT
jgi:hypothetical protein